MRTTTLAALSLITLVSATGTVAAQSADYLGQNRTAARAYYGHHSRNGVRADGRCRGMSYGTGARSCGTATGGPVGGLNSRN